MTKLPFLVVSTSPYMRGILKFVLETTLHTEVIELESEEKALSFLKNLDNKPSMIVYDYTPHAYLVEDFVAYLREHSKHVKIIILMDKVRQEGKDLLKEIQQFKLLDESGLPNNVIHEAKTAFVNTPYLNDEEYCRVNISFLSILDGINKNLFVKINDQKYVKISREDDNTSLFDLKKYQQKGIQYLYLKRDTAAWVTGQIQNQIDIFLKSNNFRFVLRGESDSPEKRFEQKILRIADEVHLDKEFREVIEKSVEKIRSAIEKQPKVEPFLNAVKNNSDHGAFFNQKINITSLVACVMARQLDWISKATIDKIIYASVLCDITLAVRPDLIKIRSFSEFEKIKNTLTEEDQRIFLSHPKDSASLIKKYFSSAPPDTDALAYQHHELPDGSGFPLGIRQDKFSPLSALFAIANDFAYYYLLDDDPSVDDFIMKAQGRYDYMNFRKVVKSLERLRRP